MAFYIYILRCSDGSCYVGQTDDLERRIAEHDAGEGSSWTAKRLPLTLAWSADFASRDQALEVEAQLKRWGRAKKESLIADDWDLLSQLGKNSYGEARNRAV